MRMSRLSKTVIPAALMSSSLLMISSAPTASRANAEDGSDRVAEGSIEFAKHVEKIGDPNQVVRSHSVRHSHKRPPRARRLACPQRAEDPIGGTLSHPPDIRLETRPERPRKTP